MDKETLERLKDEHGEIETIEALGVVIAVKTPSAASFDRFMSTSAKDKSHAHKAMAQLVRDCLVYPSAEEYAGIIAKRPGLAVTFGSEVAKIAGLVDEVERKKA